jgi:predicted ArsR family transcriptional regulator
MGRIKEAAAAGTYPAAPGWKEPTTARAAANRIHERAAHVRELVLNAIRHHPMTADEVAEWICVDKLTVRPRVSELRNTGQIEPVPGVRRKNRSGNSAMVWRIKQ